MFPDFVLELAVLCGVDADHLARPAEGDLRLVGADVGGEHAVGFIAGFDNALARGHTPDYHSPELAGPAAPRQQKAAVAAEL